jgi:hypothetical protein
MLWRFRCAAADNQQKRVESQEQMYCQRIQRTNRAADNHKNESA